MNTNRAVLFDMLGIYQVTVYLNNWFAKPHIDSQNLSIDLFFTIQNYYVITNIRMFVCTV